MDLSLPFLSGVRVYGTGASRHVCAHASPCILQADALGSPSMGVQEHTLRCWLAAPLCACLSACGVCDLRLRE